MTGEEPYRVRNTVPADFEKIRTLSLKVYPTHPPWEAEQLQAHLERFPEGQIVVEDISTGQIVGMAASLIVKWSDYEPTDSYLRFIGDFFFSNHDPTGRTLYGAEVMVDPDSQGEGVGSLLYEARRQIVRDLGLLRIRAGARIPGYQEHASSMDVEEYVRRVEAGELNDPTLSFQLANGFRVLQVVPNYFRSDPETRNYAVLIEWLNDTLPAPEDYPGPDLAASET
jgi:GNAT superfamily N-acetyltransferase